MLKKPASDISLRPTDRVPPSLPDPILKVANHSPVSDSRQDSTLPKSATNPAIRRDSKRPTPDPQTPTAPIIVQGIRRWLEDRARSEHIDESLGSDHGLIPPSVRAVIHTAIREHGRIEHLLAPRIQRPPHGIVNAALHAAIAEILLRVESSPAPIVHHWVDFVRGARSLPESRFANAILRGVLRDLDNFRKGPGWLYSSHPRSWVDHWATFLAPDDLAQLLDWNQRVPEVYLRWLARHTPPPPELLPTPYPDYWICSPDAFPKIAAWWEAGAAIVQDPAQRHAVEQAIALNPATVLDACAAPGGKSIAIAAGCPGRAQIVANDIPGARHEKLAADLARLPFSNLTAAGHDFRELPPREWIGRYDLVLVDAPCSNTGVFRRHPDAKWRHHPGQLPRQTRLQQRILENAARCVRMGGDLIYSTCSIDPLENEATIHVFCDTPSDTRFALKHSAQAFPWRDQTDGAAAFTLRRIG